MAQYYRFEVDDNNAILIAVLEAGFNLAHSTPVYIKDLRRELDQLAQPVFFITDATRLNLSFGDLVSGLALVAPRSGINSDDLGIIIHPNIKELIVISTHSLVNLGRRPFSRPSMGANRPTLSIRWRRRWRISTRSGNRSCKDDSLTPDC